MLLALIPPEGILAGWVNPVKPFGFRPLSRPASGCRLLLAHAVERPEAVDESDGVDAFDLASREDGLDCFQSFRVVRDAERRDQNFGVADVEIRIACREASLLAAHPARHGKFHNIELPPVLIRSLAQDLIICL